MSDSTTRTRHHDPLISLTVILAVATCLLLLFSRLAHASTDPTPALTGGAAAGWDTFSTNGPYWGGIVVAYVALQTFLSRQHWLAQGRLLSALTGVAMIGAAVVNWHFAGAPSAGIMTAAVAAVALVWHPTVPGAKPSGGTSVTTIALLLGLAACAAGSTARTDAAAGLVTALDCEAAPIDPAALADARLFADAKVQGWIAGSAPTTIAALKAKILADLAPVKSNLGRCAIAGALAVVTAIAAPTPGVATSALTAGPDPVLVRAAFAAAARTAGWAPVRLAGGEVL